MDSAAPKIGIFWIYNNTVIARNEVLDNVMPDSLMLYDTHFEHAVEWEKIMFTFLVFLNYFTPIIRRLIEAELFTQLKKQFFIFMPTEQL